MSRLEPDLRPLFWRQLAGLLRGGLSLPDALQALGRDAHSPAVRGLTEKLRGPVADGEPLSVAAERSGAFDDAAIACLRSGESSGQLITMLRLLADHEERSRSLRLRARMVLAYPVVLWCAALVLSSSLFWAVRPLASRMHLAFQIAMPVALQVLLPAAYVLNGLLLLGALCGLAFTYAWRRPRRNPGLRRRLERGVLVVPVWSRYWRAALLGRFMRGLATLLEAGLPLDRALELAGTSTGSLLLADEATRAAASVRDGGSLTTALRPGPVLSPTALWSLRTAEERGDLIESANELAVCYEDTAEIGGATALTVLEPAAIMVVGVIAALSVLAVALPTLHLYSMVE